MYYLDSVSQAKEEIRKRKEKQGLIQQVLDRHIKAVFGIENFSTIVSSGIFSSIKDPYSEINQEASYGILARQVPGTCTEDIACYLISLRLGLVPFTLAFTRDTFHSGSNDKLFRVKVPFTSWSKKGNLTVQYKSVVTNVHSHSFTDLDMMRLDRFHVEKISLPEYHRQMQQSIFTHFQRPYLWGDISSTWGEILAQSREAGKHPSEVWKCGRDEKDFRWHGDYSSLDARSLIVRPSSKWYYYLYLSMFLDGRFVLLETYDNDSGGVPEARLLFEREMRRIYEATGFMPLVVKTYPLRQDMLYVNQHIADDPSKAADFLEGVRYWSNDTVSMTRWFADQVIQFR